MCRQLQCYYEECGHREKFGFSKCYHEKKYPGTCRVTEPPDSDEDTGLCARCREHDLYESGARLQDLYDRQERREGGYHSHGNFNLHHQRPWQGRSGGGERQDYSDRESHFGSDGDEWEIIQRAPEKRPKGRNGSQDSWESRTMSDGSGRSVRSGRSDRSERSGRRSRH